ncbi:MAG: class I SAM-dependent methyltransferase [Bacteroidota bacterium]
MIFIDPFPDEKDYKAMYPVEYQGTIFKAASGKYRELFRQIRQFNPAAKNLLDYGCGNAELVCDAAAYGYTSAGVEYNPGFVAELKRENPAYDFMTIDDFYGSGAQTYDVIVLNNVLEHITNPNEILTKLRSRLNEGGLLVCLGPVENNFTLALVFRKLIFSIRKRMFHKKASHIPYHITFTTVQNQKLIFRQNQFTELSFRTDEVAWPFPAAISFKSPKSIVFGSLAKISMACSKLFSRNAGNTFTYIGRK